MDCRLEGKVAIITGAASGIGEAAARLFSENGARVVIVDIQDELGHQVAVSIGRDKSCYKHCDVRAEKQVQQTVDYALEMYGRIDIIFSNAGIMGPPSSIMDMDVEELDNIMAVNMRGSAIMIKHGARAMVARQTQGSIICTASVASLIGGAAPHSYAISKHALLGLVRSASCELGKHGIRVNCISPFVTASPLSCNSSEWDPKTEVFVRNMPNLNGILLNTRHVAESALFLASDESCFVSGHNLVIDGGFTSSNGSFSIFREH